MLSYRNANKENIQKNSIFYWNNENLHFSANVKLVFLLTNKDWRSGYKNHRKIGKDTVKDNEETTYKRIRKLLDYLIRIYLHLVSLYTNK